MEIETQQEIYQQLYDERLIVVNPDVGTRMREAHWKQIDFLLDLLEPTRHEDGS